MGNFFTNLNGKLKSKIDYWDSSGVFVKVSEQVNFYTAVNRKVIYNLKYDNVDLGATKSNTPCGGKQPVPTEFFGFVFPAMQSEKVLLDSSRTIDYGSRGSTQNQTVFTKYTYSQVGFYSQLWKTETIDSKNIARRSELYYPYDYSGAVYDSLKARNMINTVVGQKSFVNNVLVSQVFTQFKFWQGFALILPDSISTGVSANNIESVVRFNSYDAKGNVLEYLPRAGQLVSFLWDFNLSYPMAKVFNAGNSAVAYTSFETSNTGNWTISDQSRNAEGFTGRQSFILNSTNSVIYATTSSNVDLIVSYWSRTGVITITGVTNVSSKTGITRNGWTYYEHRIRTSGSNVTLTALSANVIDELRLYPTTAQMETYTYLPILGTTTKCDVSNAIVNYIYDAFGRLFMVKDGDGNVLKTVEYNYKY